MKTNEVRNDIYANIVGIYSQYNSQYNISKETGAVSVGN